MAEGDGILYKNWKTRILGSGINHTASMKAGMVTGYTPSQSHDAWNDVSASEVSCSGYSAGGKSLASEAVTLSGNNAKFDALDTTWSSLSCTSEPNYAIVYKYNASAALAYLVGYWQISTATNGGDYTLQWNTSGIVTIT
jgi:hypothetical protein